MAIFTAGSIPISSNIKQIREEIYAIGRRDLDSSAIKISLRQSANRINYIAFLPKTKMYQENILKVVTMLRHKSVVTFELEHKLVGVICDGDKIVDYILDKPQEYAKEFGYKILHTDNMTGAKLVALNLDREEKNVWIGGFLLLCTVIMTTLILYVGYDYLKDIPLMKAQKEQALQESQHLLQVQKQAAAKIMQNIDLLSEMNAVEKITRECGAKLHQMRTEENKIFVEINKADNNKLRTLLPPKAVITKENTQDGTMEFYYEKI